MGLFKKKQRYEVPQEMLYDPYFDLESEIVGEVQRIIKADDIDKLPDYEAEIRQDEETRKHLVKLLEMVEACDTAEMIVLMMVARENYPNMWHKVNAKVDAEQRDLLKKYEELTKGETKK